MKKSELKRIIKPLVKECVQETLLESGLLSNIVAEVAKGLGGQVITEQKRTPAPRTRDVDNIKLQEAKRQRKDLLDAIGKDAFNGVNLFEDTAPLKRAANPTGGPEIPSVLGDDPGDAGVDISSIMGGAAQIWQAMK